MLTIKDLQKTYKSKQGDKHQALKGINLELGNKGFIVLLGRSGSGKSTLLNIIGGLDNFDRGEIIIKDKSTKDFKSNEWDSYRNTYVGFVFQEFYIIEEFTVGKNIALALELQGFKSEAVEAKVIDILKQVDLDGYVNRKPNEISGGQKQRIAIARALVKDPQIILADEPTGNLDSETGRMVLETLKRLSETKLVIMVTHDADFAREYGDRIIELKDGMIINDYINHNQHISKEEIYDLDGKIKSVIKLPKGRTLTQNIINYLNQLLMKDEKDVFLSITDDEEVIKSIAPSLSLEDNKEQTYDVTTRLNEGTQDDFILKRTSLPLKNAFKLAINSIFTKKLRLIFMTILFITSLVFVGIATNFSFYDIDKATILTFEKGNVKYVPIYKEVNECSGKGSEKYCYDVKMTITDEEFNTLNEDYQDISFLWVKKIDIPLYSFFEIDLKAPSNAQYYSSNINNAIILNDDSNLDVLIGDYPINQEVMITDFLAETFLAYKAFDVDQIEDLVDQEIIYKEQRLKISGILKTDYRQFDQLKDTVNYNDILSSDFYHLRDTVYNQLYMNESTYVNTFNNQVLGLTVLVNNEYNNREYKNITVSVLNQSYNNNLIGQSRQPQNEHEIIMTLTGLMEWFRISIDGTEKDLEHIENEYLNTSFTFNLMTYYGKDLGIEKEYKIVGIVDDLNHPKKDKQLISMLISETDFNEMKELSEINTMMAYLGGSKKENEHLIQKFDDFNYKHDTQYSNILYMVDDVTESIRDGLYITGGVFALFASFLIFTFISSSISYRQKEIGTLRAIGARGIDVSKIFISEGLIIALFSSTIANIVANVILRIINNSVTKDFNLNIVLLYVNILSILSVLLLSIVVVFGSTFIPIKRITVMKPIKAIKNIK